MDFRCGRDPIEQQSTTTVRPVGGPQITLLRATDASDSGSQGGGEPVRERAGARPSPSLFEPEQRRQREVPQVERQIQVRGAIRGIRVLRIAKPGQCPRVHASGQRILGHLLAADRPPLQRGQVHAAGLLRATRHRANYFRQAVSRSAGQQFRQRQRVQPSHFRHNRDNRHAQQQLEDESQEGQASKFSSLPSFRGLHRVLIGRSRGSKKEKDINGGGLFSKEKRRAGRRDR